MRTCSRRKLRSVAELGLSRGSVLFVDASRRKQSQNSIGGRARCFRMSGPVRAFHTWISLHVHLEGGPSQGGKAGSGLNAHCPGMTSLLSHGRQRQEHPETQSLRHCAWRLPTSGAAVLIAGGRGGQTGSEYSESSPPASGLARHCMPPRRPGQVRMFRRRQDRLPDASKRRQTG